MTDRTVKYEEVPEKYRLRGGRWVTSSIVSDEVDPLSHPLAAGNKVVIAPGIVTGTSAPTSARVSVGAKSPLTGTIKEANAGTKFSQQIARLGIKAIVIEGRPAEEGKFWTLELNKDGSKLVPTPSSWIGKGLYETIPLVYRKHGDKVGLMTIGVAGEMKMPMEIGRAHV
jgi:aldehyde:ferredoxin oxidoreductase